MAAPYGVFQDQHLPHRTNIFMQHCQILTRLGDFMRLESVAKYGMLVPTAKIDFLMPHKNQWTFAVRHEIYNGTYGSLPSATFKVPCRTLLKIIDPKNLRTNAPMLHVDPS